jgi:hypothetical protein
MLRTGADRQHTQLHQQLGLFHQLEKSSLRLTHQYQSLQDLTNAGADVQRRQQQLSLIRQEQKRYNQSWQTFKTLLADEKNAITLAPSLEILFQEFYQDHEAFGNRLETALNLALQHPANHPSNLIFIEQVNEFAGKISELTLKTQSKINEAEEILSNLEKLCVNHT